MTMSLSHCIGKKQEDGEVKYLHWNGILFRHKSFKYLAVECQQIFRSATSAKHVTKSVITYKPKNIQIICQICPTH